MRALIVDDSSAMRKILRRALGTCGFEDFAEADTGRSALEVLEGGQLPACAFVDWNMPEMTGIELVRTIRSDHRFDAMAIVMVTSETSFDNIQVAMDAGADEYVMKPFTTDVIVAFPGETDDDFERTLAVVDAAQYDAAYTFVFSPRPGTPAATMTDEFVTPDVAQERMRRLVDVVERHALARHQARLGRTEQVLVEGPSKKDPALWSGRTRQNKLVHFAPGDAGTRAGRFADVHVTFAAPHWLRGDLVGARTRIPVSAAPA